jgi:hypothetical protein
MRSLVVVLAAFVLWAYLDVGSGIHLEQDVANGLTLGFDDQWIRSTLQELGVDENSVAWQEIKDTLDSTVDASPPIVDDTTSSEIQDVLDPSVDIAVTTFSNEPEIFEMYEDFDDAEPLSVTGGETKITAGTTPSLIDNAHLIHVDDNSFAYASEFPEPPATSADAFSLEANMASRSQSESDFADVVPDQPESTGDSSAAKSEFLEARISTLPVDRHDGITIQPHTSAIPADGYVDVTLKTDDPSAFAVPHGNKHDDLNDQYEDITQKTNDHLTPAAGVPSDRLADRRPLSDDQIVSSSAPALSNGHHEGNMLKSDDRFVPASAFTAPNDQHDDITLKMGRQLGNGITEGNKVVMLDEVVFDFKEQAADDPQQHIDAIRNILTVSKPKAASISNGEFSEPSQNIDLGLRSPRENVKFHPDATKSMAFNHADLLNDLVQFQEDLNAAQLTIRDLTSNVVSLQEDKQLLRKALDETFEQLLQAKRNVSMLEIRTRIAENSQQITERNLENCLLRSDLKFQQCEDRHYQIRSKLIQCTDMLARSTHLSQTECTTDAARTPVGDSSTASMADELADMNALLKPVPGLSEETRNNADPITSSSVIEHVQPRYRSQKDVIMETDGLETTLSSSDGPSFHSAHKFDQNGDIPSIVMPYADQQQQQAGKAVADSPAEFEAASAKGINRDSGSNYRLSSILHSVFAPFWNWLKRTSVWDSVEQEYYQEKYDDSWFVWVVEHVESLFNSGFYYLVNYYDSEDLWIRMYLTVKSALHYVSSGLSSISEKLELSVGQHVPGLQADIGASYLRRICNILVYGIGVGLPCYLGRNVIRLVGSLLLLVILSPILLVVNVVAFLYGLVAGKPAKTIKKKGKKLPQQQQSTSLGPQNPVDSVSDDNYSQDRHRLENISLLATAPPPSLAATGGSVGIDQGGGVGYGGLPHAYSRFRSDSSASVGLPPGPPPIGGSSVGIAARGRSQTVGATDQYGRPTRFAGDHMTISA